MTAFPPTLPADLDDPDIIREHDWRAFRALTHMSSHWNRPGWTDGRRSYHWLLDFAHVDAVRDLAERCQAQLGDKAFDFAPLDSLHVTIGRIGFADELPQATVLAVAQEAVLASIGRTPFQLHVGPLAGSHGALRFSVTPWTPLFDLYDQLAVTTGTVLGMPAAMDRNAFRPHLSVAYANSNLPVASLMPTLERLRRLAPVETGVASVALVLLRREGQQYRYESIIHFRG